MRRAIEKDWQTFRGLPVLPVLLAALTLIGVYLQWLGPGDLPARACVYPSAWAVLLGTVYALVRRGKAAAQRGWAMRVGAIGLFVLVIVLLVTTSLPPIGRRIGPWAGLRCLLVAKSREVAAARVALDIPPDRPLTAAEMGSIEALVLDPAPEYTFPIVRRTVRLRLMRTTPPYVGVDFGGGRRAVFDLATMAILYAD